MYTPLVNIRPLQKLVLPCKLQPTSKKSKLLVKPRLIQHAYQRFITSRLRGANNNLINCCNRKRTMFATNYTIKQQNYDYFLILDFEATCDIPYTPKPQEIIEFPVLKLNGKTFDIESTFHTYVKPKINKELSSFCVELTGIIQDNIDNEPHLEEVLTKFNHWYQNENLSNPNIKSIFVTCGDWDLYTMLPEQCKYFDISLPNHFKRWINIKKSFAAVTGTWPKNLTFMNQELGINPIGRLHSGIDDCKNIAAIMKRLAERGHIFLQTNSM